MSMKNSSDNVGNRTRDVPACNAVPQPTAPPRAPREGPKKGGGGNCRVNEARVDTRRKILQDLLYEFLNETLACQESRFLGVEPGTGGFTTL